MRKIQYIIMRKFAFVLLMFLTLSLDAQDKGIIKFMGIPVDGSKSEMIYKLKQKGFTYDYKNDEFKGKFDGDDICGVIQTYNDKVYNIRFIYDSPGYGKSMIIHKYNLLVQKYDYSEKYMSNIISEKYLNDIDTYKIDPYEDIKYGMQKGKIYRAQYFYIQDKDFSDTTGFYQFKKETISYINRSNVSRGLDIEEIDDSTLEKLFVLHKIEKDIVQFYIIEGIDYGSYLIMFDYWNTRNAPNGEDL